MKEPIRLDEAVGGIAARRPASIRVFERHGIDFCCGGEQSLADACAERGLDAARVATEVGEEEERTPDGAGVRWDEAPVDRLVAHIVARYHRPLEAELARLRGLAGKVVRAHGDKDPVRLRRLAATLDALADELLPHAAREEAEVFPRILAGKPAGAALASLIEDHEAVGAMLARARADAEAPLAGACATWEALRRGVADLGRDCHEHVHLENNVLFPRVARGNGGD